MIRFINIDDIYFNATRKYFNEVLNDFYSGCYRSATVMLYSVAVCDLILKLQELRDMYNDSIANSILIEYEKKRNNNKNSSWERELIERIYKDTELLDNKSYNDLEHLYDHRNFAAHPSLDQNFELISPNKETVMADIVNTVNNILSKPSIFAKKVVDMMTEDIAASKELYSGKNEEFKRYIDNKYVSHMSNNMKLQTIKAFWKLCFCLTEDEKCRANIIRNRKVLELLFDKTETVNEFIKDEAIFKSISQEIISVRQLCILLSRVPELYDVLDTTVKLKINCIIEQDAICEAVSWFKYSDKKHFLEMLLEKNSYNFDYETMEYVKNNFLDFGYGNCYFDFCVEYYGKSEKFDDANSRFISAIKPNLAMFNREQFIRLIKLTNENNQIYNRNSGVSANNEIVKAGINLIGKDFDFDLYPHFIFNKSIISEISLDDTTTDLPF